MNIIDAQCNFFDSQSVLLTANQIYWCSTLKHRLSRNMIDRQSKLLTLNLIALNSIDGQEALLMRKERHWQSIKVIDVRFDCVENHWQPRIIIDRLEWKHQSLIFNHQYWLSTNVIDITCNIRTLNVMSWMDSHKILEIHSLKICFMIVKLSWNMTSQPHLHCCFLLSNKRRCFWIFLERLLLLLM